MGGPVAVPLSADEIALLRFLGGRKMPGTLRQSPERTRLFRMGYIEGTRSTYATQSEGVNYSLTAKGAAFVAGLEPV